jgi:Fe-S-cluster containining protein
MSSGKLSLPLVELDGSGGATDVVTADISVTIGGEPLRLAIIVPSGPTRMSDLLPVVHGLTDLVVGIGIRRVQHSGAHISCRAGCGACCRQPVPISESEARQLKRLVDAMPQARRTLIRERFATGVRRLAEAGLLDQFRDAAPAADGVSWAVDYFRLGVPCPFLEDESCSIHSERPTACREYLVTSPAEECSRPAEERVQGVPLPVEVGKAVRSVDRQSTADSGKVPLILALEWAEANPEPAPTRTGPDLLRAIFAGLGSGSQTG